MVIFSESLPILLRDCGWNQALESILRSNTDGGNVLNFINEGGVLRCELVVEKHFRWKARRRYLCKLDFEVIKEGHTSLSEVTFIAETTKCFFYIGHNRCLFLGYVFPGNQIEILHLELLVKVGCERRFLLDGFSRVEQVVEKVCAFILQLGLHPGLKDFR